MEAITLKLSGVHDQMDARAVSRSLDSLIKLVQSVAKPGDSEPVLLSDLRIGSAVLAVQAPPEDAEIITRGLGELREGGVMPSGWNDTSLRAITGIYEASRRAGVDGASLDSSGLITRIDAALAKNVADASGVETISLGSVRGKLYRYSSKNTYEASLSDAITGAAVKLKLSAKLAPTAKELIDQNVVAWGALTRHPVDRYPTHLSVKGIKALEPKPSLPRPVHEGRGILGPDWTGGLGAVEWVRAMRNG